MAMTDTRPDHDYEPTMVYPNARDALWAAFDGAICYVQQHMQDGALREIVLSELRLAYRRAAEKLN
jgi:hypothetical protein